MPSHRAEPAPRRATSRRRQRARHVASQRAPQGATHRSEQRAKKCSPSVSQASIAGALGLATIAAPISGVISLPAVATAAVNGLATARAVTPRFPLLRGTPSAIEDLQLVPDDAAVPQVPSRLAAPHVLLVTRPSRGRERAVLPGCFGTVPLGKVTNGELPAAMLCTLWDRRHQLRADAAVSLAKLNVAYGQTFGHPMCVSDAYRTLDQQYEVKAERGGYAARPGTSVHGLGLAVDLCDGVDTSDARTHRWMVDNAARYGWTNPAWALAGGGGPFEPWHWEYHPDGARLAYAGE